MLKSIVDLALGFIARLFFGQNPGAPAFDLDQVFDRLSRAGDRALVRLRRLLIAVALAGLAAAVLTVRVFQMSANQSVSVLGLFEIDGAILFGLALAAAAAGAGWWLSRKDPMAAELQPPRELPRPAAPAPSPIEEAVALWILQQVEKNRAADGPKSERAERAATPTSQTVPPGMTGADRWETTVPTPEA